MSVIDRSESLYRGLSRIRQFARYSIGGFLGSISAANSRYRFVMDLLEKVYCLRVENSALVALLVKKGVFTADEWEIAMDDETRLYEKDLKRHWPEVTPAEDGMSYTLDPKGFAKRCETEKWPP